MWTAIKNAKHRVDLETYILVPDEVGLQTLSCLTDAAKRGCRFEVFFFFSDVVFFPPSSIDQCQNHSLLVLQFYMMPSDQ